jgi:gluconokinase
MAVTVVSGVAGSGKSTVGAALAARTGVEFADADDFHPPVNVAKMTAGIPLSDADRWPWLSSVKVWMADHPSAVLACSALRLSYRDYLRPAHLVYLRLSHDAALARLSTRRDHFFGAALLDSQFAALEEPSSSEDVLVLDALSSVDDLVEHILDHLGRLGPADA